MSVLGLAGCARTPGSSLVTSRGPDLPDPVGFAGMAAGATGDPVLAAGGANFPGAKPWEGGVKNYSRSVFRLESGVWRKAGELSTGFAYAASAATREGLVIAGGCDDHACFDAVIRLHADAGSLVVETLPALPARVAFAAYAKYGDKLVVIGGVASPAATSATSDVFSLDLRNPGKGWSRLASLPAPGRMLATAGVLDGRLYVMGGVSLSPVGGKPVRTYLHDVFSYDDSTGAWRDEPPLSLPLAAAPGPAPAFAGGLVLAGGDAGEFAKSGKPPTAHPGQPRTVWLYRPAGGALEVVGETAVGVVTAPVVEKDGAILVISGESAPGVRTPVMSALSPR